MGSSTKALVSVLSIISITFWATSPCTAITTNAHAHDYFPDPRGEQQEKVGNWTQGEKNGRASGVLSASLPSFGRTRKTKGGDSYYFPVLWGAPLPPGGRRGEGRGGSRIGWGERQAAVR
eukprot:9091103-Pyramimonas_sp.AAC.3